MTAPMPNPQSRFDQLIGISLSNFGTDGGYAQVRIGEQHHQPWGITHGGLYCAMVETVASISGAVWLQANGGGTCVGVNNNTDFLRALTKGLVTAVSTPLHRGRRQQLWLVEITDESSRLIARGQVRLQNLDKT